MQMKFTAPQAEQLDVNQFHAALMQMQGVEYKLAHFAQ